MPTSNQRNKSSSNCLNSNKRRLSRKSCKKSKIKSRSPRMIQKTLMRKKASGLPLVLLMTLQSRLSRKQPRKSVKESRDYNCLPSISSAYSLLIDRGGPFSNPLEISKDNILTLFRPRFAWQTLKPKQMTNFWKPCLWRSSKKLMRDVSKSSLPVRLITNLLISTSKKLEKHDS